MLDLPFFSSPAQTHSNTRSENESNTTVRSMSTSFHHACQSLLDRRCPLDRTAASFGSPSPPRPPGSASQMPVQLGWLSTSQPHNSLSLSFRNNFCVAAQRWRGMRSPGGSFSARLPGCLSRLASCFSLTDIHPSALNQKTHSLPSPKHRSPEEG